MSFPYSEGNVHHHGAIPIKRQTYHFGGNPVKSPRDLSNGVGKSDALVRSTPTSMSVNEGTTNYRVEHLASFQHESGKGELTPADALARLSEISEEGGLWTQVMSMKVTNESISMANGETMELIEDYPLENISLCTHVTNHPIIQNLFIFSTRYSNDKVGAIHLFQCKSSEAPAMSTDINKRREIKAKIMSGAVVNGGFHDEEPAKVNGHQQQVKPSSPTQGTGVHQRIEAFQKKAESPPPANVTRSSSKKEYDYGSAELREKKINRDVETLNRCIEEMEEFIVKLKEMNDARKKLSQKGPRKSMKQKYERQRTLSKGPSQERITDIFQKFKFAFNLLGKLKTHIKQPNAPELLHYIFVPLEIIVKLLGLESARTVESPLLTVAAIDLMSNCLDSREASFWKSLGPNWNLPQSAPMFHGKVVIGYVPVFKDGWMPPEIVSDEREAAAAKSTAVIVAKMKEVEFGSDKTKTLVLRAVERFRSLAHEAKSRQESNEERRKSLEPPQHPQQSHVVVEQVQQQQQTVVVESMPVKVVEEIPKAPVVSGSGKYATVVYDYWAHNNKELTIRAGEKVMVLDDTRRWWLVKNDHDEQGYVPSTVLAITTGDTSSETSSTDGTVSPPQSPAGTGNISALASHIEEHKAQRNLSLELNTTKSIMTESKQFSPTQTTPPPVFPKPETPIKAQEAAPNFVPPPPPAVVEPPAPQAAEVTPVSLIVSQATSPSIVVNVDNKHAKEESIGDLQAELNKRLEQQPQITNGASALTAGDGVDFFIPLFKSSTADDVSRWLKKLKFEPLTVERLSGTAAKELFKIPQSDLVTRLGEDEGNRLFNELQAQTGAMTRHKSMTEFQKALLERMKRQETIQKNVTKHHVVVKTPGNSAALSQEEMQRKFKEQQDLIKSQQKPDQGRQPEKPTFSSFQGEIGHNNNNFDFTSETIHEEVKS
eukprot:Seg780.2 transcript_id=Seg780.2/GoldUCD/mRNA.D3Y31 product="Epidermal growth factor receptor kinase substrate 8" protein_id=Seg780.2/GoldUCD/D3Y31